MTFQLCGKLSPILEVPCELGLHHLGKHSNGVESWGIQDRSEIVGIATGTCLHCDEPPAGDQTRYCIEHFKQRHGVEYADVRIPNPDPTIERLVGTTFYGNKPFDMPYITEIERNLWVGGCTSGLVLPDHIKHVVSLYFQEHYSALHMLSSDLYVQMADSVNESFEHIDHLARWVNHCRQDAPTLVHCQVGLNRSALVAALALYMSDGWPGADIVDLLREKRSPAVMCNPHFELEVRSWK